MTREQMEARRLAAARSGDLALMTREGVGRKYGITAATASRWVKAMRSGGVKALRRRKAPGRPSYLTPDQLRQVAEIQSNPFARLTAAGLRDVIERSWGVRYNEDSLYGLMRRLGVR